MEPFLLITPDRLGNGRNRFEISFSFLDSTRLDSSFLIISKRRMAGFRSRSLGFRLFRDHLYLKAVSRRFPFSFIASGLSGSIVLFVCIWHFLAPKYQGFLAFAGAGRSFSFSLLISGKVTS